MLKSFQYYQILNEEDCKKKILNMITIQDYVEGKQVSFLLRGILLLLLKLISICFEYLPPLILTQMDDCTQKYAFLIILLYIDFFTQKLFTIYLSELLLLTNASLSQKLFNQCLKTHNQTTFKGILKELRQVEKAIRSFYDLFAICFELPFVYVLLKNEIFFDSIQYGVILSLFALIAASIAQIYAWRIQNFQDQRLRLTQDLLCSIKSIKYQQWENVVLKLIQKVRQQEFQGNKGIQYVDTFVNFFRRMTQIVLLFVAFYKLQYLETSQFYTVLIFFDKLVHPINAFPWCFGEFLGSIFSVIKLYDYFQTNLQDIKLIDNVLSIQTNTKIRIFDKIINIIKGDRNKYDNIKSFNLQLNFTIIPKNKLICIIGQVGCGKTTLLDYLCNGSYVSQNAWLFSGTVKDNILFGQIFNEKRYQECLKASAIDFDDNKYVGFNGTNLSGGQKQRIAFCRSIYNESDSYYFDDIFSSVDENVADHMFKSITTLLKNKTIILVLNQHQYLQYADYIIKIENNVASIQENINFEVGSVEFKTKQILDTLEPLPPEKEVDIETEQNLKENYQFYIKALGFKTLLFFIISSILHQIFKGGFELWIHNNMQNLKEFDKEKFVYVFLILAFFTLIRGFSYSYSTIVSAKNIFDQLMSQFLHLPTKYYDIFNSSFFIRRLFDDVNEIDDPPLNYFFSVTFDFLGLFALICSIQFEIIPYVLLSSYFLIKNQQHHRVYQKNRQNEINKYYPSQDFDSFIIETEKGHKYIKFFKQQINIINQFQKIILHKYANQLSQNHLEFILDLRNFIVESGVLILLIINGNKLSYTYAYLLFGNQFLSKSIQSWRRIITVSQSLQRMKQIINFPLEENLPLLKFQSNQILYQNVWLSYGMAKGLAKADYALKGVSFSINKGQKIAFCGRTGSGKSSLFNLLVKLYDFQKGDIQIFGNSITEYGSDQLRSLMSVIPQSGLIFSGSIKDNIDPENIFNNKTIDEILNNLGFHLNLQKEAKNLSNGEKQVINFIQAILRDREIILMDEATSNMDQETNNKIMENLFKISINKTLLLISHKLENLQNFDKIYVMSDGYIISSGTYNALLKDKNFLDLKSVL